MVNLRAFEDLLLNERQKQALSFLATHGRITSRDYQQLCPNVHPETLRRDFADLIARGVLLKIGDKRATYYIFKSPPASLEGDEVS
jgi:ATP-dependent DNA helicase RecG